MTSSLDWLVTRQIQHAGSRFGVCETAAPHVVISRELVADDPVKSGEWTAALSALFGLDEMPPTDTSREER